MSKPLSQVAITATFFFLIATSIIYIVSLPQMLRSLREHFENANSNTRARHEYLWEASQVVLPFSNGQYHITSDSDWASLFPSNDGRIPSPTNPDEEVMVSMHHQLHCLNIIRIAYLDLHKAPSEMPPVDYADVDMCLEQLRQHIMCNCDLTLEPTMLIRQKSNGEIAPGSTGMGVDHRCLDWEKLTNDVETKIAQARM